MNGPQHYCEAERLLDWIAEQDFTADAAENTVWGHALAAAQVHATLALAAAQVDGQLGQLNRLGPGAISVRMIDWAKAAQ